MLKSALPIFLFAVLICTTPFSSLSAETGKTVAWINSYNDGYAWSDGIGRGIRNALRDSGAQLIAFHMDTKLHNRTEQEKQKAGVDAFAFIQEHEPDVVITSDDNAQQYLVVPFLRDTDIPVVFCGVNAPPEEYGFPAKNVTGMLEVEPVQTLHWHLHRFSKGERIGYISGNVATDEKVVEKYNHDFFEGRLKSFLANDFEDFKEQYLRAQQEVDMLMFMNNGGIDNWDDEAAARFILESTSIPTGTVANYLADFAIVTLGKDPEEQGEYAGRTALGIMKGTAPGSIPLARNEKVLMTINLDIAQAANIVLPISTLKAAEKIIGGND